MKAFFYGQILLYVFLLTFATQHHTHVHVTKIQLYIHFAKNAKLKNGKSFRHILETETCLFLVFTQSSIRIAQVYTYYT